MSFYGCIKDTNVSIPQHPQLNLLIPMRTSLTRNKLHLQSACSDMVEGPRGARNFKERAKRAVYFLVGAKKHGILRNAVITFPVAILLRPFFAQYISNFIIYFHIQFF